MTRRIPTTVVQLGTVLDLTTQEGDRRTTWQARDVGGLLMCADSRAMQHGPGRAALYLLRPERGSNPREPDRQVEAAAMTDGDVLIEYAARHDVRTSDPKYKGWGAYVWNVGLASSWSVHRVGHGFETREEAIAAARAAAEAEAAHYRGDWKIQIRERNPRKAGPSGYTDCACRDCFDTAIGTPGKAMCWACEEAGCEANDGECQRSDAYGVEDDSRSDNRPRALKNAARAAILRAERIRIDRQGYANKGRDYFGVGGLPLFRVVTADSGEFDEYIRAPSAAEAKAHALAVITKARARDLEQHGPRRNNPEHGAAAADTYERWHRRAPADVCELDNLPDDLPHYIGRALRIGYRSDKWHGRGNTEDYDHDYTEPGYSPPGVWADDPDLAKATAIVIRGGNQRITPGGID